MITGISYETITLHPLSSLILAHVYGMTSRGSEQILC